MEILNVGNKIINNYIIKINEGYLLIDTGYPNQFNKFYKRLKKNNVNLKDIKYILLTHAHDDHAGFLNELLDKTKASLIVHPNAIPLLKQGQNSFLGGCTSGFAFIFCKLMDLLGKGDHRFPPIEKLDRIIVLDENTKLDIEKKLNGKIINLPGHTKDSIGLLINNILFCGDAAANGILSKKRTIIWIENLDEYKKSWDIIINMNPKKIYPSHGKPFMVDDLNKYFNKLNKIKILPLK